MMRLLSSSVFSVLLALASLVTPLGAADPSQPDNPQEIMPATTASASSATTASPLDTNTIDHLAKGCLLTQMTVRYQDQHALRTFLGGSGQGGEGSQVVTNIKEAGERKLSIDGLFEQMELGIPKQETWQREKINYSLFLTGVGFHALQHLTSEKLTTLRLTRSPLSYYDTARLHLPSLKVFFCDGGGDPLAHWRKNFFLPKLLPQVQIVSISPLLSLDRTLCEGDRPIVLSCPPLLGYAGQDYGYEDLQTPSFKEQHPLVLIEKFKTPDGREWDQTHCLKHGFFYKNQPNDWGITTDPFCIIFRPPPSPKGEELSEDERRKQLTHFTPSAPQDARPSQEGEPKAGMLDLPEELIRHIATYLDDHDTLSFGLSCKFLCTLLDIDMSTLGLSPLARYLTLASRVGLSIPQDYATAQGITQLYVPALSYQKEEVKVSDHEIHIVPYVCLQMRDLEGKEVVHTKLFIDRRGYMRLPDGDLETKIHNYMHCHLHTSQTCKPENRVLKVGPFYAKPAPSTDILDDSYVIPILNHRFQQWWVGNLESIFKHNPDVLINIRGPKTPTAQMPSAPLMKDPAPSTEKDGSV
ncbi:F-box protein [Candidatus Hepatobacter penaei]|uniref:F-box protein n=1 Tax=Candidatus Hepatobacter penaei TaxID=1274402 RepID=UPI0004F3AFB3|nr:F-box protein [Candidatus Hepatobacter penaei]